jgi:hypothetical protein
MSSRTWLWRMSSTRKWGRVGLVWTGVSKGRVATIFMIERISERGTALLANCYRSSPSHSFFPEDGGDKLLRHICPHNTYTVPHPTGRRSLRIFVSKMFISLKCSSKYCRNKLPHLRYLFLSALLYSSAQAQLSSLRRHAKGQTYTV